MVPLSPFFGSRFPHKVTKLNKGTLIVIRVVVKMMGVPFWTPVIIRHLIFRVPQKRDRNFDSHPSGHWAAKKIRGTFHLVPRLRALPEGSKSDLHFLLLGSGV